MKPLARGLAALLALPAADALAHAPVAGAGPFLNGALHPLAEPAQLLSLLLAGLWLGQLRLQTCGREALLMALAFALGLAATHALGAPAAPDAVLLAPAAALGLTVALQLPLPRRAAWPLLALIALLVGVGTRIDMPSAGTSASALAGSACAAALLTAWVAVVAQQPQAAWARIALRVVASWLSAAALLVLALQLLAAPPR